MNENELLRLLEKIYVELSLKQNPTRYGYPIHIGGKHIWGREGLFEELNKRLEKPISWEEFKQFLERIRKEPKYFGRIYITFILSPKGTIEPHDIIFYKPISIK